ncbi:MAG: M1 family metallopeptidase [Gammaproteobacteria bacterium]
MMNLLCGFGRRLFVLATWTLCTTSAIAAPDQIAAQAPLGQLNGPATPVGYQLDLTVLPRQDTFNGSVSIDVDLSERAEGVYLHGRDLKVSDASVRTAAGKSVRVDYRQLTDDGVAYAAFARPVDAGRITLSFTYEAPFDRQLLGLYRVEEAGLLYAFTQFESIFARKAFVSFDEPRFKTPFEMTLTVRDEHTAIFNTEAVEETKLDDGLKRVRFATTEKMPTYLVALAVGELDVVEGKDIPPSALRKRPLPLRGIAAKGKGADLAYALATTGDILAPLEEYFGQPYPYSKLDIIAVPDFQSGAMENAGAVTFRERLLLLKPDAPVTQKQAYASVMAHELAHMWFGNLVTMPWWNDIWLNESFATWMSYKAIAQYNPGARPELRRLGRLRAAKREDGLVSARQIREPVNDHHGIVAAFDGITYAKGGAVLNMLENSLGEERFRDAVRDHMTRFAWGNADVNDFIDSLVRVSTPVIGKSFKSYLFQNGLPSVAVTKSCANGAMTVAQSRFVPLGSTSEQTQSWVLPLCVRYGRGNEVYGQCEWLESASSTFEFDGGDCPDWMMLDANFAGYYQWQMPAANYAALHGAPAALLEAEWESVADSLHAGLVDGSIDVRDAWTALEPMAISRWPSVALAPSRVLESWLDRFGDEPKVAAMLRQTGQRLYAGKNVANAFDADFVRALSRDEDRVFYGKLARFSALVAREPTVRKVALASVSEALTKDGIDYAKLTPLTRQVALTVAVQDGDDTVRERILNTFLDSGDAQYRAAALSALGHTTKPKLAARLRQLALDGRIRTNEISRLLNSQLRDQNARNDAWRFVRDHYDDLLERMPPSHAARLPKSMVPFCDTVMVDLMLGVFAERAPEVPGGQRELDKAIESIEQCAARSEHERAQVRDVFAPGIRR